MTQEEQLLFEIDNHKFTLELDLKSLFRYHETMDDEHFSRKLKEVISSFDELIDAKLSLFKHRGY